VSVVNSGSTVTTIVTIRSWHIVSRLNRETPNQYQRINSTPLPQETHEATKANRKDSARTGSTERTDHENVFLPQQTRS